MSKKKLTNRIEAAIGAADLSEVTSDHLPSGPWITVVARKKGEREHGQKGFR